MIDSFLKKYIKALKTGIRTTNTLIRKYLSLSLLRFVFRRYLHSLITIEQEEVLTAEMGKIKVELKFFDEYNHLAEKCVKKVDRTGWKTTANCTREVRYHESNRSCW